MAIKHFKKLSSLFNKNHFDKLIAFFEAIDIVSPIIRPTIKSAAKIATRPLKQKQAQSANITNKETKKNWATFDFYYIFCHFLRYK